MALARHLGKSKDSVSRLVKGDRALKADEAALLASFFGDDVTAPPPLIRLPVFGYAAAGGDDRVMLASDQVLDEIELPAALFRGEAFAVQVAGGSMYLRLFDGERVIAERNVPPVRNREVVVELMDGTGLVKEYRGQKDGQIFLWQYNPEQELRIPLTKVCRMHFAWKSPR